MPNWQKNMKNKVKEQKEKSENPDPDVNDDLLSIAIAKKACKVAVRKV